jgi:glycine cleavage system H protein
VEGVVGEVNEELLEDPDILTGDPYDEGWFCIITNHDPDEVDALMDHEEYEATLED